MDAEETSDLKIPELSVEHWEDALKTPEFILDNIPYDWLVLDQTSVTEVTSDS